MSDLHDRELVDVLQTDALRLAARPAVVAAVIRVDCPVHGPGYGRCLGCLFEAGEGVRRIESGAWKTYTNEARRAPLGRTRATGQTGGTVHA